MSGATNRVKIAVIGGEGIGPEVTDQSRRILNWFAEHRGTPIALRDAEYGKVPYLRTGEVIPADTWEAINEAEAIVF
ncbi:MAG TPA: isocitrate/isopropylmalate family dehydrogenase, partial [Reyranella sp.]|nr:isocitrate/isopropylmalate family dehydrogenase [Reyranella sp.]